MSEKQEPRENQLAAYIGVSGPETPKFLLVNNFLSEFFQTSPNEKKNHIRLTILSWMRKRF